MAEGFLQSLDSSLAVVSAGTSPVARVHPLAVKAMQEAGIDISAKTPKNVQKFVRDAFDYVITVCDNARESCPIFSGKVDHRLHFGFDDPAKASGTEEEKLRVFRRVRDEIKTKFSEFYRSEFSKTR